MYAETFPTTIDELKIDLGKHIVWTGLVKTGEPQKLDAYIKNTPDTEFVALSEKLRDKKGDELRSICTIAQRALDSTKGTLGQRTLYMSIHADIRNNFACVSDAVADAKLMYFDTLIRAATISDVELDKILTLIVEFGDGR